MKNKKKTFSSECSIESSLQKLNNASNTPEFNLTFLNLLRNFFKNSSHYDSNTNANILNKFESFILKLTTISTQNVKRVEFEASEKHSSKLIELNQHLTLNFDFSFFSLIKIILIDNENLIEKEAEFLVLLNFCLTKCINQYELFKSIIGKSSEDDQDEFNILELINNFHVNLLNLLHCFKETKERLENNAMLPNLVAYYEHMSSLVSIYLDVSLELKFRFKKYHLKEYKQKNFKQKICLNVFYLLDSSVFYICNTLLQVTRIDETNVKYLEPIIGKIVELQSKKFASRIKCVNYLRTLLVYRKLRIYSEENETLFCGLLEYIKSVEIPRNFKKFSLKLLNQYSNENILVNFKKKLNDLEKNKKIRKLFLYKLDIEQLDAFLKGLQNYSKKIPSLKGSNCLKTYDNESLIKEKFIKNSKLSIGVQNQLNNSVKIVLNRIDLKNYTTISKYRYLLSNSNSKTSSQTTPELQQTKIKNNSHETVYPYEGLTRKKYDEIASRRPSPSPENITKLNLFRNIFLENNPYIISNSKSHSNNLKIDHTNNSKYYKLNELVSVKINEDYFREKYYQTLTLTPDDSMDIDDELNADTTYMITSTPQFKD